MGSPIFDFRNFLLSTLNRPIRLVKFSKPALRLCKLIVPKTFTAATTRKSNVLSESQAPVKADEIQ